MFQILVFLYPMNFILLNISVMILTGSYLYLFRTIWKLLVVRKMVAKYKLIQMLTNLDEIVKMSFTILANLN
jgi:hypothetical protein